MHDYGGVDVLQYEDVPTPRPGPGEVLVRAAATSVNPIDWKIRRGDLKNVMPLQFPWIPGRDVAGEVVEVGDNVSAMQAGQRVIALVNKSTPSMSLPRPRYLPPCPRGSAWSRPECFRW